MGSLTAAKVSSRPSNFVLGGLGLTVGTISYVLYSHFTRSHTTTRGDQDVPIEKLESLPDPRLALQPPPFSQEQVDTRLRANEVTRQMSGLGIGHYDRTSLPSNSVMEDAYSEAIVEMPDGRNLGFWGIYDGHIGTAMSTALSRSLVNSVALELGKAYATDSLPPFERIAQALKSGFLAVDDHLIWERQEALLQHAPESSSITSDPLSFPATQLLQEAFTGSSALLSIYDSRSRMFYVALAGDSRAVLGRRREPGSWAATVLTLDQYGLNPDEEARIRAEHPGEKDVLKNNRLLGSLEPTRSFGDLYYKWTDAMQDKIRACFLNDGKLGRQLAPNATPPYLTAEPLVTSVQIQPEKGDFVVMASDGLWELLSNEEVVGLVGRWVDEQRGIGSRGSKDGWKRYISSPQHSGSSPVHPDDRFVLEDGNAATHLLRNALGGKLHEGQMVRAMLTLSPPLSRRYRDDLTIMVIFFDGVWGSNKK
ncbi:protein serine/threonine phosphatase 2C [Aspergillus heteromorphus CBS 117.55]|uniref:Protein serine/threonine phosphatase 2C n=1 Tax=Aspergillus heteromorphus CBS 117.55 TaxID=1448321 RepID=A0A317WA14_9EURO|nr:protein serine/threonine phosphatase 2C [Aspergillus heteromorphus CBS 117.55]PWY83406.1 protein serine/threonine phosphatase 2C [Aspergillus heteromorphus CBS 117.55]